MTINLNSLFCTGIVALLALDLTYPQALGQVVDKKIITIKDKFSFQGKGRDVWSIAVSPDSKLLAFGQTVEIDPGELNKGAIAVWEIKKRKIFYYLREHTTAVKKLGFSKDGKTLVSVSLVGKDGEVWSYVLFWQADIGKLKKAFPVEGRAMALWSDEILATVPLINRKITHVYSLEKGKKITTLEGPTSDIEWIAISPDGKKIATLENSGFITEWDIATGKEEFQKKLDLGFRDIFYGPDGRVLYARTIRQIIKIEIPTKNPRLGYMGENLQRISPDGQLGVRLFKDNVLDLFSTKNLKMPVAFLQTDDPFWNNRLFSFSPDGRYLFAGGDGGKVRMWELPEIKD